MFSSEFCETFKNTYFYRTPPVAATVLLSGSNSRLKFKQLLSYYPANIRLGEDIFRLRLQKTALRRLQDVLIKTNIFTWLIRLQKTSSRRLAKTSSRHLEDVFKTSSRHLQDILLRRFQDVLQRCLQDLFKTYHWVNLFLLTRFQDVFETFSKRF